MFKVKKIFNFFAKRVFSMFQDSGIILSKKNFFRLSDQSESRYRNEILKAETPSTCNQRRQTLPVRITWKGDWTSGVSLRCECASRGQKCSKSKKFSTFLQNGFSPYFRTLE